MTVLEYRKSLRAYAKQRADMIDLSVGDIVEVYSAPANGWAKGVNTRTKAKGWFPYNITQQVPNPNAAPASSPAPSIPATPQSARPQQPKPAKPQVQPQPQTQSARQVAAKEEEDSYYYSDEEEKQAAKPAKPQKPIST